MTRAYCGVLALMIGVVSGCVTGPMLSTFPPARSAHGVNGRISAGRQRIEGELLEVSDTALVLRDREGVVLIRRGDVTTADFAGVGYYRGEEVVGTVAAQLRLLSRFPSGLTESTLRVLLRDADQTQLRIAGR